MTWSKWEKLCKLSDQPVHGSYLNCVPTKCKSGAAANQNALFSVEVGMEASLYYGWTFPSRLSQGIYTVLWTMQSLLQLAEIQITFLHFQFTYHSTAFIEHIQISRSQLQRKMQTESVWYNFFCSKPSWLHGPLPVHSRLHIPVPKSWSYIKKIQKTDTQSKQVLYVEHKGVLRELW